MSFVKTFSLVEVNLENTPKSITLIANGGNGNYIFNIVKNPTYGSLLEIKGNHVIYIPTKDYVGYDSFIYNCTDTITTSAPSTVIINTYAKIVPDFNITNENIINANIFETPVITLESPGTNYNLESTYTILDSSIGLIDSNKVILKKTGKTQIIYTNGNQKIYTTLNVYYFNKNNINNVISPTLSYQRNAHIFYQNQIKKTNKIINTKFKPYTPIYFQTSYDRIFTPNVSTIPN